MKELWKIIPDFTNYKVSTFGRVSNKTTEKILKPCLNNNKRPIVTLRKKKKSYSKHVHRLVLEAFVGPCPEGCEADHIDRDKSNNKLENLRWLNIAENRSLKGRQSSRYIDLKKGELWLIKNLLNSQLYKNKKLSRRKIAMMFMVHAGTIKRIENNVRFKHEKG